MKTKSAKNLTHLEIRNSIDLNSTVDSFAVARKYPKDHIPNTRATTCNIKCPLSTMNQVLALNVHDFSIHIGLVR